MKVEIKSNRELGKILKQRREKLKITQKQLADICDLSHNGISRIEIGNSDIKLSTLLKISRIIGVNLIIETGSQLKKLLENLGIKENALVKRMLELKERILEKKNKLRILRVQELLKRLMNLSQTV